MSSFDPIWYWWRRLQEEHRPQGEDASPRPPSDSGSRAGTYSPHYVPTTPPSPSPVPDPATPPVQTGNSAVGSASFDIRQLLRSAGRNTPTPRKASAIAASPPDSIEMQVDSPEISSADALAMAEAMDDPRGPPRTATQSKRAPRRGAPLVQPAPAPLRDTKGRPMIKTRSSRRSVTPPASEAYNEEGEEEREDEEEEEEEDEEEPPRPANARGRFPLHPRAGLRERTRGKSKKGEVPAYTLANQQREPTVFDAGCSNCILRDRECDHAIRSLFTDHARAANHLEPYTRLSNTRGNELITDLSAARANYELARKQLFRASARIAVVSNRVSAWIRQTVTDLGPYGLPRITELPEALRPLWGQLLIEAEAELSVDYRAAVMHYPFISDPRRTDLPTDEDLPTLIEFLTRRAARARHRLLHPRRVRIGRTRVKRDHRDRRNTLEFWTMVGERAVAIAKSLAK
ncbi:hypothetical protein B0H14DRAFT_3535401 [Mycena olivaceomarginata]|nr:hypothetical protein B0H14DRAFT_3535401 [Mycena olivaceomarginata]